MKGAMGRSSEMPVPTGEAPAPEVLVLGGMSRVRSFRIGWVDDAAWEVVLLASWDSEDEDRLCGLKPPSSKAERRDDQ